MLGETSKVEIKQESMKDVSLSVTKYLRIFTHLALCILHCPSQQSMHALLFRIWLIAQWTVAIID